MIFKKHTHTSLKFLAMVAKCATNCMIQFRIYILYMVYPIKLYKCIVKLLTGRKKKSCGWLSNNLWVDSRWLINRNCHWKCLSHCGHQTATPPPRCAPPAASLLSPLFALFDFRNLRFVLVVSLLRYRCLFSRTVFAYFWLFFSFFL